MYKKVTVRKIIFLDIDGVLNTIRNTIAYGKEQRSLDPVAIGMINELCRRTGAKVCISSVWRFNVSCKSILNHCGFKYENFVSFHTGDSRYNNDPFYWDVWKTPVSRKTIKGRNGAFRGDEIKMWLNTYGKMLGVKKYVAIDDDSDFFEYQKKHHFTQTDSYEGFMYSNFKRCVEILGEEKRW